ncbi:MAG: MarR family transcriptional regulator [Pseudomonadota bacterium]|nr:MarR family transcriptional regulator [Pseudomonadota bacterium]
MDRLKNFGFLLKDVSRRYVQRFEQHAAVMSMTLVQCRALVRLEKNEGISQAGLAELIEVEPMAMVRIIDRMQADGLLERRLDPDDRRARRLHLTPKSKPLLEEIWRLADLTRAETFAGVPRAEREAFIAVLERLDSNLSALDAAPATTARAASRASSPPADGRSRSRRNATKQES